LRREVRVQGRVFSPFFRGRFGQKQKEKMGGVKGTPRHPGRTGYNSITFGRGGESELGSVSSIAE